MYQINKQINPIVSKRECVFTMPLRHIYSTLAILQITLTAVSIGAESQVFIFERVKVFYFMYKKIFFMKIIIPLKQFLMSSTLLSLLKL